MRTVAVLGASLAGLSAARALRAQGYDGRLVVIGAEQHAPYDRPPLSREFLLGTVTSGDIALGRPEDDGLALEWRLGRRASQLDRSARTVTLESGEEIRADGVVLAVGARARSLPGTARLAGVHTLRTLDDAVALRHELRRGGRLVVVGAGFIGAEVASTARALGVEVTVLEAVPIPLAGPLGVEMGRVCAQLHGDHGARLVTGIGVAGLVGTDRVRAVRLADDRLLPADLVVVGVGARPDVDWLAGSGLAIDGGVVTDAACATNLRGVVAVGDCAVSPDPDGALCRVEHWTNALERASTAAATLLAGERGGPAHSAVPYFWSEQYGVRLQFAGHRRDGDTVRVIEGDPDARCFVAVYERDGEQVAVLGMNSPKLFTRLRRQLGAARPAAA
jgi:NADPH-dependent 2,4-dienoyl-CoA reductase/sulfur reductase-like enzyme